MWTVSDLYKSKIEEREREWKICVRIRYKNNTQVEFWDDDIIGDPAINSQCVSGGTNEEMIDIGAVCAKTLELTIIDTQSDLHRYAGARADINVYLKTGSKDKPETDHDPAGYEKIPMGSFWVDTTKLSRVGQNITFTAYDGIITLQYLITDNMRAAMKGQTATTCAALLAAYSTMGFEQDLSELPNVNIPLDFDSPQIVTAWDGVMWIAQLMGCFARAGRKNFLEFVPIKSDWEFFDDEHTIGTILAARNIQGSERYATTFSDDRIHIIGVAMEGDDKKIVTCGGGGLEDDANVTILMEKNPLFASSGKNTYEILSAILDQISTAYFYSFQTEMRNDPALDAGDVIRLQGGVINGTNKNNDLIGFITHSTWKYHGRQTITNVGQVPIVYRDAPTAAVAALSNDEDGIAPMAETRAADDLFQVAPVPQSQKVVKGGKSDRLISSNDTAFLRFHNNQSENGSFNDPVLELYTKFNNNFILGGSISWGDLSNLVTDVYLLNKKNSALEKRVTELEKGTGASDRIVASDGTMLKIEPNSARLDVFNSKGERVFYLGMSDDWLSFEREYKTRRYGLRIGGDQGMSQLEVSANDNEYGSSSALINAFHPANGNGGEIYLSGGGKNRKI